MTVETRNHPSFLFSSFTFILSFFHSSFFLLLSSVEEPIRSPTHTNIGYISILLPLTVERRGTHKVHPSGQGRRPSCSSYSCSC
jgi:hypothetical protein